MDPPVLLLHGFPDRALLWRHQIVALREAGYRVIAPDLRGFGDTDRPAHVADYAVSHSVADVLGLLDTLGVEQFRLAAHDWGATVGWVLASTHPDRVLQYAALSVGHPSAIGAAGFEQKQRTWYMLWFNFPRRRRDSDARPGLAVVPRLGLRWRVARQRPRPEPPTQRPAASRRVDQRHELVPRQHAPPSSTLSPPAAPDYPLCSAR